MGNLEEHQGLKNVREFPLLEALMGRRARRFGMGYTLPEGPLAFESKTVALPLSELETLLVVGAAGGNTGWHYLIERSEKSSPNLPGYPAGAGGRTYPSAAGWQTSEVFFTDDTGTYVLKTRDAPKLVEEKVDQTGFINAFVEAHRLRTQKISPNRLFLPGNEAHIDNHNIWCANKLGSLLIIPVLDLSQQMLGALSMLVENGKCIYDNLRRKPFKGLERFKRIVDVENPLPLSEIELSVLTQASAEVTTSCYAGMLMLQAMGLGGWLYTGLSGLSILGASGDPSVPGLGFRYDTHESWVTPNPTGLPGVFEAFTPPHFPDMHAAVEAFSRRKVASGGPFAKETPGPWKNTPEVRGSSKPFDEEAKECVASMAQGIFDTFGKFPATVPSVFTKTYLQAHHLDLEFYDRYFEDGAYLRTHKQHMEDWHSDA